MTKTENYNLNQWESSDRVLMEDFNEDNRKIEEALNEKANSSVVDALSKGQIKIETGSYTGTGAYGTSTPTSLTFGFVPKLVFVLSPTLTFFVWNGGTLISGISCPYFHSFSGKTLKWSHSSVNNQMNVAGSVYQYLAIG